MWGVHAELLEDKVAIGCGQNTSLEALVQKKACKLPTAMCIGNIVSYHKGWKHADGSRIQDPTVIWQGATGVRIHSAWIFVFLIELERCWAKGSTVRWQVN